MGKTQNLGHLAHIVAYDGSNHITVPAGITMHTNQLVASQAYVTTALGSYALSSSLGSYVPTSRTITINGTTLDLSANMSFTIAAGLTSFNTRTGAITLSSGDVTTALGFTPYNVTNPAGYITGITSANVTTALGFTPYNATNPAGYITGISFANVSAKPTTLSGYGITDAASSTHNHDTLYVPVGRTITINGTTLDLSANRSFTVSGTDATKLPLTGGTITGTLSMATTGTNYIRMGVFANSTSNSGEAWIGRASDRNAGTMTVQLGGASASSRSFEVVDYAWTTVLFSVGSNGNIVSSGTISSSNFSGSHSGTSSGTNTGDQTNISGNAGSATNLTGQGVIQRTSSGESYSTMIQVRETSGASGNTNIIYAPALGFHWGGVVASSIRMNAGGEIQIVNNPGNAYEAFRAGTITGNSFNGPGTGLTGTAASLNIGGNSSTVGGYSVSTAGSANTIPTRNASGYLSPENWIQFNGNYGLYFPNHYGLHFYPNNDGSYGPAQILGEKSGWRGLHFGGGTGITLMMNEGEFGFHRQAVGWVARFTSGTGYFNISGQAGSISGQANSATINATSGNAGNNIVLRDGNGDIAIGTLNTNHAYFGGGGRGLTSADTYGSYGNVMTYGTGLNGWYGYGIYDNSGYRSFFMSNGGNFGIYGQTIGKWAFYYGNSTASYAIGSDSPVAGYTLYLIYGLYTVGLYNASDARMKKDIKPLSSSLDKVKQLRGVSYEYIDKGPDGSKNKGLELGFIAQEVLPVIPELIRYDDKKGYAMNYNGVSAVLVEAVKEQQVQIENQQKQINTLILQLTELLNK